MGRLGFLFQLQLTFSKPVNHHAFQLRCLPKSSARQEVVQSSFCVLPECETMMSEDYFGMKQSGSMITPHAGFSVQAEGVVNILPDLCEKADSNWKLGPYRQETFLTAPGFVLKGMAEELPEHNVPAAVMSLLSDRFVYAPGKTHAKTTAEEAAAQMQGVCQDEAHIMLSLLRMKGIPCRYIVGYMLGEGSTHAWVEVLHGETWIGLDPTNHRTVNDEYILISAGRDANDCPVNRGVFSGAAEQQSQSSVSVWHIND